MSTTPSIGRAQSGQSGTMPEHSREILAPTSLFQRLLHHDPSRSVRAITRSLIDIWPAQTCPRNPKVAAKRAKLMNGTANPIESCYTLTIGGLDEGKSIDAVTQWAKDLIAAATQYAERRPKQGAGVLPFPEVLTRVAVRAEREDCEADVARMQIKADSLATLETARTQRLEAIAAHEAEVEVLTQQIASLRG